MIGPELARYLEELQTWFAGCFGDQLPLELVASTVLPYVDLFHYAIRVLQCTHLRQDIGTQLKEFEPENRQESELLPILRTGWATGKPSYDLALVLSFDLNPASNLDIQLAYTHHKSSFWDKPMAMLYLLEAGAIMDVGDCIYLTLSWRNAAATFLRKYLASRPQTYGTNQTYLNYVASGTGTFFDVILHSKPDEALDLVDTPGLNFDAINTRFEEEPIGPFTTFCCDGTVHLHAFMKQPTKRPVTLDSVSELAHTGLITIDPAGPYRYKYIHKVLRELQRLHHNRDLLWLIAEKIFLKDPSQLLAQDSKGQTALAMLRALVMDTPLDIVRQMLEMQGRLMPEVETEATVWDKVQGWLTDEPELIRDGNILRFIRRAIVDAPRELLEQAKIFR